MCLVLVLASDTFSINGCPAEVTVSSTAIEGLSHGKLTANVVGRTIRHFCINLLNATLQVLSEMTRGPYLSTNVLKYGLVLTAEGLCNIRQAYSLGLSTRLHFVFLRKFKDCIK